MPLPLPLGRLTMGRPRLWESDADRMRAYRAALAAEGIACKGGKLTAEERLARQDARDRPCQFCGAASPKHTRLILCSPCYERRRNATLARMKPAAPWPGPCAYLDGEAFENGEYALLQTLDPQTGEVVTRLAPGRLTSRECFQHLFDTPVRMLFGYGLKYDVSNWLADLPIKNIEMLRQRNFTRWGDWKIDLIPGKMLKIRDDRRNKGDRQRIVYDLLPFYQQPFVTALEASKINVPEIIRLGKRLRGRFLRGNITFVKDYNEAELRAMVELHASLCGTLIAGDCKIRYWFGPGSCARLKAVQNGVEILGIDRTGTEPRAIGELGSFLATRRDVTNAGLEDAAQLAEREASPHACVTDAFYGGRFELSQQGPLKACWEYDLSSAYPWALSVGMPCFACGGEWREADPRDPWSVWRVSWEPWDETHPPMWGPFPVRMTRNLAWTSSGTGWYHRCEIEAAQLHLGKQYHFHIHKGWSWFPKCEHDPWSWVGDAARERVAIKHSDPAKAQCLKLALNSLYGITADKAGVDKGRIPRYHNPYWAGLITARTRARLLEAAGVGGESIVYLATDGVHSSQPLLLSTGEGLGDWEAPSRAGVPAVFLAPGTYLYADGKRGKSRGVNLGKFSTDIRTWERLYRMTAPKGEIRLREKHFVPFVEALARSHGDLDRYRAVVNTWSHRDRKLSYDLSPRRSLRADGRWIAPNNLEWLLEAQLRVIPTDRDMMAAEEVSSYQPDWVRHKLDLASQD